eukprot:2146185-Pleurochrysis_carterae.AAC.1
MIEKRGNGRGQSELASVTGCDGRALDQNEPRTACNLPCCHPPSCQHSAYQGHAEARTNRDRRQNKMSLQAKRVKCESKMRPKRSHPRPRPMLLM